MSKLLSRFLAAALTLPLLVSAPLLRRSEERRRQQARPRPGAPAGKPVAQPPSPTKASGTAMRAMRDELRRILDEHDGNRMVFRHLARFERKFSKHGLRILEELPVDQLRRALSDFESLVRNWSSASLADLRSRMSVVLADRMSAASMWVAVNSVSHGPESITARLARHAASAFRLSQQAEVDDVNMSRFEAAMGEWNRRAPQGDSKPAA